MVAISIDNLQLAELCSRWKVLELSLFGSVLRDDFRKDSDVDILVTYQDDANWGLFDHMRLEDELAHLLGHRTDLVSRRGLERSRNALRRNEILNSAERIYVS